jgi:hypothetical protein
MPVDGTGSIDLRFAEGFPQSLELATVPPLRTYHTPTFGKSLFRKTGGKKKYKDRFHIRKDPATNIISVRAANYRAYRVSSLKVPFKMLISTKAQMQEDDPHTIVMYSFVKAELIHQKEAFTFFIEKIITSTAIEVKIRIYESGNIAFYKIFHEKR